MHHFGGDEPRYYRNIILHVTAQTFVTVWEVGLLSFSFFQMITNANQSYQDGFIDRLQLWLLAVSTAMLEL